MSEYSVFYNAEVIDEEFKNSPFRLKNDLKGLKDEEMESIAKAIGDELNYGFERPACKVLYKNGKKLFVGYVKIRCGDSTNKKGKSGGFRCIVLVDTYNTIAVLLHLYKHSETDNISQQEKNKLRLLVDEYVESIRK